MAGYFLEMFGISLAMTLALELPIACAFGFRRKQLLLVALVNILTNPAAVLLHWLGLPQIPIEIAVISVEGGIYCWFSGDARWNIRHPVPLSAVANILSYSAGLLIQWIGGRL